MSLYHTVMQFKVSIIYYSFLGFLPAFLFCDVGFSVKPNITAHHTLLSQRHAIMLSNCFLEELWMLCENKRLYLRAKVTLVVKQFNVPYFPTSF